MNKSLDESLSQEIAETIKSKAKKPFDNAYKAVLATEGAKYVQGFIVVTGQPYKPIEHAWIELEDKIIDPTFPHFNRKAENIWYFSAQSVSAKKLKTIIDESKEDYPEDDPLPIYGDTPYQYYGDVMLGDQKYLDAYQVAEVKCREINGLDAEKN
ncbi:hypothetical protein WJM97_11215 [Okeanomitos corallinicola TIOX110]|uniref:Uncharacterized protein n=1 Tax=Okeanomitos corallinicola TIOX110 TaxID=3133117 RepID=A0ABZ2UKT3_9CYAN